MNNVFPFPYKVRILWMYLLAKLVETIHNKWTFLWSYLTTVIYSKMAGLNTIIDNVQEVYFPLALFMGCGEVERHLEMVQPTKKTSEHCSPKTVKAFSPKQIYKHTHILFFKWWCYWTDLHFSLLGFVVRFRFQLSQSSLITSLSSVKCRVTRCWY